MDCLKTGKVIYELRKEKNMTQKQLAEKMNISDKTVSKWERGLGCPDLSLLPCLSKIFDVDIENIISGNISNNKPINGNMKNIKAYICNQCGNVLFSTSKATASCCGKKLHELKYKSPDELNDINISLVENDFFITSDHIMTKEHYITFIALATGDTLIVKKQYPEWNVNIRIPKIGHGTIFWCCNKDGLFYKNV